MARKALAAALATAAIAAAAFAAYRLSTGHTGVAVAKRQREAVPTHTILGSPDPRPRSASPRSAAKSLSLPQLAGERVIYAYPGLNPPPVLLRAIRSGEAAGVILFSPNISSEGQLRAAVNRLRHAGAASPVHAPPLILVDQEGGAVRRLPGAPTLSERQIGESADGIKLAREAGTGAGQNLAGAGIDVNLAPVLDVFRHEGDFIDAFGRSYSSDPGWVARLGRAFVTAQQRQGVASTAKHFPGLGAATRAQDTDASPVTLHLSLKQLRTVDEAPYRSAIAAGVKLVMTSWATYPALDPALPAGLSSAVIQRELRGRLHFRGVTVTDTINAGALDAFGPLTHRGVLAAAAGADLLICSAIDPTNNNPGEGIAVRKAITAALAGGELNRSAAAQAAARVIALRRHP